MIGRDPKLVVDAVDESFHPPTSTDPSWIETMWFPFWVPAESMTGSIRVRLSPNLGELEVTIAGWRGDSEGLFGDRFTVPIEGTPNLLNLDFEERLQIDCLEALRRHRIRHKGRGVELDLLFEAIMPPNPVSPEASPGMFAGHFEQPGRVTGTLVLRGREIAIDCHSIRDRSWGPRQMPERLRLGNAYATAPALAFFAYVNPTAEGVERITHGYHFEGGVEAALVEGLRETRLRDGLPESIRISAVDAAGRSLEIEGTCVNTMASNAGNGVYATLNLVRWSYGGGEIWGENHDVWNEADWLAAGRRKL